MLTPLLDTGLNVHIRYTDMYNYIKIPEPGNIFDLPRFEIEGLFGGFWYEYRGR